MASDLGFCCNKDHFSDSVPKHSCDFFFFFPGHARNLSRSFLTKLYLPVSLWKENKMKKQQLEIAFYSDGHLGSEALLPIRKVPPLLFLYPLSLSLASILLLRPPSYIRATASVVPSSTVTNWHAEFSTGTLNSRDQAYRESSFISFPLWKLFMFIT